MRHSELSLGNGVVMVSSTRPDEGRLSPRSLGGLHQTLAVVVEDPDAHHARAVREGAEVVQPLRDEEHDARGYMVRDPEGHLWYFGTYRPGAYWE